MLPQPVKVFIVDDSAQFTEVLSELIAVPGRVEIAGTSDSAKRAVEEIHRLKPDVIIVDLQLKDGNGFDVVKAIRSLPNSENTVVVLFTNHMSREFQKHAMELGADFFLDKSKHHAEIVELIQNKVRQQLV
jgi:DNA-binding NarL/FixJ family response regulator